MDLIIMYQWWFNNCDNSTVQMKDVNNTGNWMDGEVYGNCVLPSHFFL